MNAKSRQDRPRPARTRRSRRGLRLLATAAATLVAITAMAPVAGAASDRSAAKGSSSDAVISVRSVDATGSSTVIEGWLTGAKMSDLKVKVDGDSVKPEISGLTSGLGHSTDVVAVLDNAESLGNATVQLSKRALVPLMPGAGVVDHLGIVSTGTSATLEQGLTSSPGQISAALDGVRPDGVSQVWAGLARAADMLGDRGVNSDGSVVLFTSSPSDVSEGGVSTALSALRTAGVDLHVVALPRGNDMDSLQSMVDDLGGTMTTVSSDEDLDDAVSDLSATLSGRFQLVVPSGDRSSELTPLSLSVGDTVVELSYVPGALRVGSSALSGVVETSSGFAAFLAHPVTKWLIVLMGITAAVMLFWAVVTMILPDETNLVERLVVYEDPYGEHAEDLHDDAGDAHATVPIIRKAVELTGDIGDRRGVTEKLDHQLEQANVPLRAAEAMFFLSASAILAMILTLALKRNLIVALLVGVLVFVLPRTWLNIKIRRRQKAFVNQLPDMLTLLAGTLRAGYSIAQGFESVSTEISEPMGRELRRVVSETRLGRPLEESLEAVAERMDSDDFAWAVMAIRIQREVGGNLAELLLTVADTMTQRERLRRDVSTLTAEGRMSAFIIGLLPPGLAAVMFVMNPAYIKALFSPGLGYALVAAALVMMGIGFAWMKKTVTIDV